MRGSINSGCPASLWRIANGFSGKSRRKSVVVGRDYGGDSGLRVHRGFVLAFPDQADGAARRLADHLKESLSLLRAAVPRSQAEPRVEMVTIPEQPYDTGLWTDVDDEGLGARDRHAP